MGRTIRVRIEIQHTSAFLRLAVEVGFDWVYYASDDYLRMSVIRDSELSIQSYSHVPILHSQVWCYYMQGEITPMGSVVAAATAGQSFDPLFSAV
jgi:hypothetical protein